MKYRLLVPSLIYKVGWGYVVSPELMLPVKRLCISWHHNFAFRTQRPTSDSGSYCNIFQKHRNHRNPAFEIHVDNSFGAYLYEGLCFIVVFFFYDQSFRRWIPQLVIPGILFNVMTIRINHSRKFCIHYNTLH